MSFDDLAREVTRKHLADGGLIEAGWRALKTIFKNKSPEGLSDLRLAFFAGAKFSVESVMYFTDPSKNSVENDLRRMESMMAELSRVEDELRRRLGQ